VSKFSLRRAVRLFGLRVAELRRARGLTQEKLAELIQLSPREMQRIEAGEVGASLYMIFKLAHALRNEPADLFIPPKSMTRRVGRPARS
jgi:transcriptional regulator with XRE-family HTH domain